MNDDAGSTSGPCISRWWVVALLTLLGLNVSLVGWSMNITIEPQAVTMVQPMEPSPAQTILNSPPRKSPTVTTVTPPAALPPAPSEPIVVESEPALRIVNPRQTGGAVHYAVDGEVFSLQAGECHQLSGDRPRKIEFDRGDDYGYAELRASNGTYAFGIGASGWSLKQVDEQNAKSLLDACEPIAPGP
jgi:hypothetical protein